MRIVILCLFMMNTGVAKAQISPGELCKAHSHLEGLSNCTKCHELGKKVSGQKCLDCHVELNARIRQNKGYHASSEVKGKECVKCHSDHHGLNFRIVKFETEKFSHALTGYELEGSHARVKCADCHKSSNIASPEIRKKKFTYLGLTQACVPCHADYHQQTLPKDCRSCHNYDKFIPAPGFDHDRARFRLTGRHQAVTCSACHKTIQKNGKPFREFSGLRFENCNACHQDVHQGKFGQNCKSCHTEQSFTILRTTDSFNHDLTDFRLEGKHRQVECKKCHKSRFTDPLTFAKCSDCHTDYHDRQFVQAGKSPDCAQCHTTRGFSPSNYSLEQHNSSAFPLKGGHLATPCFACHKKSEKWNFRQIGLRCADCHEDIHYPAISEKHYPQKSCEKCHNEERWNLVRFDHNLTAFTLSGAHAGRNCRDCHFKKEPEGKLRQTFAGLPGRCSGCHQDVHYGQFEVSGVTECTRCHTDVAFRPASKFDHDKSRFPLDGKHQGLACNRCHSPVQKDGSAYILYKTNKIKCEDCHQ